MRKQKGRDDECKREIAELNLIAALLGFMTAVIKLLSKD